MAQATLQVRIWTDGDKELPDGEDLAEAFVPHLEHIKALCEQGYQAGEVIDDKFHGWWDIKA